MKTIASCAVFAGLLVLCSCTMPIISKEIRDEAVPITGFVEIRQNPDKFKGKTIIIGGVIVTTMNNEDETTTLTILTFPLNKYEKPKDWKDSQGRLIVNVSQFLDPAIYANGREVTVAGTVSGVETAPVGKMHYKYVVIKARQIYLWPRYRYHYVSPYWFPETYYWGPPWYPNF